MIKYSLLWHWIFLSRTLISKATATTVFLDLLYTQTTGTYLRPGLIQTRVTGEIKYNVLKKADASCHGKSLHMP